MPRTENDLVNLATSVSAEATRSWPDIYELTDRISNIILRMAHGYGLTNDEKFFITSHIAFKQDLLQKDCKQIFTLFDHCGFFNYKNILEEAASTQDMQFLDNMVSYFVSTLCKMQGSEAKKLFEDCKKDALLVIHKKELVIHKKELAIHKNEIDKNDIYWQPRLKELQNYKDSQKNDPIKKEYLEELKAMEADPESYDNLPKSRVREVREMRSPISGKMTLTAFQPFVSSDGSKKR